MSNIKVALYRDRQAWVAQALNVDVSSFSNTQDEARTAIQEALKLYFEGSENRDVTEVSDVRVEKVSVAALQ